MRENIHFIDTLHAPKPNGPYSQAIAAGPYLFLAGQIPIDPKVGKILESTIEGQTKQVIDNIEAILAVEELSLEDIVRTEVYLKDMQDFPEMNAVYAERFNHAIKPARTTIQAVQLPMDSLVEITCIALRK
jgi:2-iminobutanoate/2-iminopropanoate deaminase